ncbi:hypothetical protein [uncultured Pseudacidovorax sp.]|nr:hypothetical protein [uncultured Pseudacidovorax sp.]
MTRRTEPALVVPGTDESAHGSGAMKSDASHGRRTPLRVDGP